MQSTYDDRSYVDRRVWRNVQSVQCPSHGSIEEPMAPFQYTMSARSKNSACWEGSASRGVEMWTSREYLRAEFRSEYTSILRTYSLLREGNDWVGFTTVVLRTLVLIQIWCITKSRVWWQRTSNRSVDEWRTLGAPSLVTVRTETALTNPATWISVNRNLVLLLNRPSVVSQPIQCIDQ